MSLDWWKPELGHITRGVTWRQTRRRVLGNDGCVHEMCGIPCRYGAQMHQRCTDKLLQASQQQFLVNLLGWRSKYWWGSPGLGSYKVYVESTFRLFVVGIVNTPVWLGRVSNVLCKHACTECNEEMSFNILLRTKIYTQSCLDTASAKRRM